MYESVDARVSVSIPRTGTVNHPGGDVIEHKFQ